MAMNVNDVKDWSGLVNQLQAAQKTKTKTTAADGTTSTSAAASATASASPSAPTQLAKESALPQRATPKANAGAEVKKGVETLSNTTLFFSVETLIELLFDLALKQREARRESRMADATAAEEMGMAAAQDIKDEGSMEITGAVLASTAQVAGASTVIGGGVRTGRTENVMEVSNKMMTYQATSQTFGAAGQVAQGGSQYTEKQDEAQKALHDASATQAKSIEDSDSEDKKDEAELIQAIIQLQQQREESRHEAMRATA